jgi:hypothetical protein
MSSGFRRQLTLFVPPPASGLLEEIRRLVDPIQSALIAVHVTLCREDELAPNIESEVRRRLETLPLAPLWLRFGPPETFHQHGILLPCLEGAGAFHRLRSELLGPAPIRAQPAHITLAHPRNPKAKGNALANASRVAGGLEITFLRVSLIEQDRQEPWRTLWTLAL